MNPKTEKLAPGLYLVATPLGAARDITLRALDLLASADVIAAEDTRAMRRLMDIHGIALADRRLVSYHDHNGARVRPHILQALAEGKSVVYASEAGTPMVADPGFDLARAVVAEGHDLISAPGPSAVICALTLSGLPTDRFFFAGFLPNTSGQRKSALAVLSDIPGTLVFYESPKRIAAMLRDAAEVLGSERRAAVARELTKKFEEVRRDTLGALATSVAQSPPKGEIVVLIDRAHLRDVSENDVIVALNEALKTLSVRDAANQVSEKLGVPRRRAYQQALAIAAESAPSGGDLEGDDDALRDDNADA